MPLRLQGWRFLYSSKECFASGEAQGFCETVGTSSTPLISICTDLFGLRGLHSCVTKSRSYKAFLSVTAKERDGGCKLEINHGCFDELKPLYYLCFWKE